MEIYASDLLVYANIYNVLCSIGTILLFSMTKMQKTLINEC